MHDPKFEKEVQRKMDELEFTPSGSVWENVQQTLTPDRRRRAIRLFWWFLLPGLLLLGAGGAVYLQSAGSLRGKTTPLSATTTPLRGTTAPLHGTTTPTPETTAPLHGTTAPTRATTAANEVPAASLSAIVPGESPVTTAPGETTSATAASGRSITTIGASPATTAGTSPATKGKPTTSATASAFASATPLASTTASAFESTTPLESATPSASANITRTPYNYRPGLIPSLTTYPGIKAPRPHGSSGVPSLAVTGLPRPKHAWAMGFAGGAGLSSFNESLLRPAAALSSTAPLYSTTNFTSLVVGNNSSSKKYTSDIQPGISWWAGVVAEKPLSARWSLTLGLNLHYYSSRLETGEQVSTYAPVYASLIAAPAVAPIQSYPYYSVGNQQVFTNQYYYLEIPAAVQWQITRSRKAPLFWRGGASLSRLMSSNALYYDDHSGVYFKDGEVINHTQLSVSSGVITRISMKGFRIEAGPEVQYGVTGLLRSQAGNGHLLYGGIRLVILPGK